MKAAGVTVRLQRRKVLPLLYVHRLPSGISGPLWNSSSASKGPRSRTAGIAMAYKLIDAAQAPGGRSLHPIWSHRTASELSSTKKLLERPVAIT